MIRKAEISDMPKILDIYAAARGFMAQSGNPTQWGKTYPTPDIIEDDIKKGQLYVFLEDDEIHGAFTFFFGIEPDYLSVSGGEFKSDMPCGIMHRIASDGASSGFFAKISDYCKQKADAIRIDTHKDNLVMQRVLNKAGFSAVGKIYLKNGEERIAYEFIK